MKQIDPTDRLVSGFGGSPSPPVAPDGGPHLEPAPLGLPVIAPIPRCELGPCRNFHRMTTKVDAQDPLDGERILHTVITRTCYPAPGIEFDVSEAPVRECSRWEPVTQGERNALLERRRGWTSIGAFRAELAAFEASWQSVPSDEGGV